ncbi:hypothetical protein D9M70_462950 [compost metagenome]
MPRRLDIIGQHRLGIASRDEDIGADDLRGVPIADLEQFRRREREPTEQRDGTQRQRRT